MGTILMRHDVGGFSIPHAYVSRHSLPSMGPQQPTGMTSRSAIARTVPSHTYSLCLHVVWHRCLSGCRCMHGGGQLTRPVLEHLMCLPPTPQEEKFFPPRMLPAPNPHQLIIPLGRLFLLSITRCEQQSASPRHSKVTSPPINKL